MDRFADWVVLTIEKPLRPERYRLGIRKRVDQARFETEGRLVEERLVGDRVHVE